MEDSWGAPPGTTVTGEDAGILGWTADLCGKPLRKELLPSDEHKCVCRWRSKRRGANPNPGKDLAFLPICCLEYNGNYCGYASGIHLEGY